MIDPTKEEALPLIHSARYFPGRRWGKRISARSLWRYAKEGLRGVRLETCLIGGRRCTSKEAIRRFVEELNVQAAAGRGKQTELAPHERAVRAGEKLKSLGI